MSNPPPRHDAHVTGFLEREILLAPDLVARAAAALAPQPEQRWMLAQPLEVRRSYLHAVLERGGGEREQTIWMLRQGDAVRHSYITQVAQRGATPAPAATIWMLRQGAAVRESYLTEVVERQPPAVASPTPPPAERLSRRRRAG
jgi:hypothetical protein